MNDGITASIILGISFWGIVEVIRSIAGYQILKKLAQSDKCDASLKDFMPLSGSFGDLKWGLIILFGGAGLILIYFLDLKADSPLPYGIESVFVALGFILYFLIDRYLSKSSLKV